MNRKSCCALILAAGASTRMGKPKQELPLLGVPALVYTLRAFAAAVCIDRMVLVCPQGQEAHFRSLAENWGCAEKLSAVISGGNTRQQSAALGAVAAGDCDLLAVHDGARVLTAPEEIAAVVQDAAECGASALAVPVKDTIKVTNADGFVVNTPKRSTLWAVQTPQVFEREQYCRLIAAAEDDFTDDCQLFEWAGIPVHLCRGNYENLKLTTPEDIPAAEAILRERERKA